MRISLDTTNLHGCFRILSAAAEADNLKLLLIQFQIASIKRKICVFTILAQMLPFAFLHTGGKLHFYSLGTTVRRKLQVSRGMQSLWLWVSNRGEKRPVGTRFCSQSLVCYTFCDRWRRKGAVTVPDRPFPAAAEGRIFAGTGGLRIFVLRV